MLSSVCEVPSSNHWQTPAQGMLVDALEWVLLHTSYNDVTIERTPTYDRPCYLEVQQLSQSLITPLEFSVPQIEYTLGGSSKTGIHVYFLEIVAMVLLLCRQIVLLWHQVTMIASEQLSCQTIVLPWKQEVYMTPFLLLPPSGYSIWGTENCMHDVVTLHIKISVTFHIKILFRLRGSDIRDVNFLF